MKTHCHCQSSSSAGNFHLEFLFLGKPGLTCLFLNCSRDYSLLSYLCLQAESMLRKMSHVIIRVELKEEGLI